MWLKRTRVKTKKGEYVYIQLVKTVRKGGRTRHMVVANLGREENVDIEKAERLSELLSRDKGDSLPEELIKLLPHEIYGYSMLFQRMIDNLGIWRMLTDMSFHKNAGRDAIYGLFALIVYYCINDTGRLPFFEFLKRVELPFENCITEESVINAITFLQDRDIFKDALFSSEGSVSDGFSYVYMGVNDNLINIDKAGVTLAIVDKDFRLKYFATKKTVDRIRAFISRENPVISEELSLIDSFEEFSLKKSGYICRIREEEIGRIFNDKKRVKEFYREEALYSEYRGIGYRYMCCEDKAVVSISPFPGKAASKAEGSGPPRELWVSNLASITPLKIIDHYFFLEKLESRAYNIYLPRDLGFLYESFLARQIMRSVVLIISVKMIIYDELESRVKDLSLTAEEAVEECGRLLGTWVSTGENMKHYHSELDRIQMEILGRVGIAEGYNIKFNQI